MSIEAAILVIDRFLHDRLGNTGVSGFEGLVALLVQQATGQEFRLSSSGRQAGRDAGSESRYANNIKIEAKHYRETTALDLRELLAEIDEATESDENLDIWILAASRSVNEQISSALDKHAERLGVEVVLLDLGLNGLPRIAVLMAAFPNLVIEWAELHRLGCDVHELRTALFAVANALDFAPALNRLVAKLNDTTGYDSARRRIHNLLRKTLADADNSRSAFRQFLGIRTPEARIIRRTELNRQLDEWWDVSGFPSPAVAIGEEGTGKTWAVFDWAMGRIDRGDMPIVLPFAAVAKKLTNADPVDNFLRPYWRNGRGLWTSIAGSVA